MNGRFLNLSLVVCSALLSFVATSAEAARLYRCGKVVQYRPCEFPADESIVSSATDSPRYKMRLYSFIRGDDAPKISQVRFERVDGASGLWRGYVQGEGPVDLRLQIGDGGAVSERYMGRVILKTAGKLVPFVFRSPTPQGSNWKWRVTAVEG